MEFKLKACLEKIIDNRGKNPIYFKKEKYPVIDNVCIKNNYYINEKDVNRYINEDTYINFLRGYVEKDMPIMTLVGSGIGKVALIKNKNAAIVQNTIGFKTNDRLNSKYLYYWFLTKQKELQLFNRGSGQPSIKKTDVEEMLLDIPCIDIQNKIVNILSKIDDKIELNNQTNDNLYELSFSLYKKWYDSLSSDNITTLSKFDEMGKIVMGQSPKGESYNYYNEGLPLINGAADYENGFLKAQKYTTMPTKICNKNDLIFCIRATIGLLTICDKEYCLGRGVAGIVNINELYREYVFHLINNSIESFKNLATGSVIVGISRNDIQNIKVKIPSKEQIKKFHDIQKKLFDKMENIRQENIVLTQLRDTLLPKLMNGEIDLDKIEI